ncbi:MAG: hypothetical protein R2850_06405 [Bacteroidia bacterium]
MSGNRTILSVALENNSKLSGHALPVVAVPARWFFKAGKVTYRNEVLTEKDINKDRF